MRIINKSFMKTKDLRELIKVAKGNIKTKNVIFSFKNTEKTFFGRIHYSSRPHINIGINKKINYPLECNKEFIYHHFSGRKTIKHKHYPKYDVKNDKELFLRIIAHELAHLRLFQNRKRCGNEIYCEKYAKKRLLVYRSKRGQIGQPKGQNIGQKDHLIEVYGEKQ